MERDAFVIMEGQLRTPSFPISLHQGHVQPELCPTSEKFFLLSNGNPSYCLYFLA